MARPLQGVQNFLHRLEQYTVFAYTVYSIQRIQYTVFAIALFYPAGPIHSEIFIHEVCVSVVQHNFYDLQTVLQEALLLLLADLPRRWKSLHGPRCHGCYQCINCALSTFSNFINPSRYLQRLIMKSRKLNGGATRPL